jgi:hypothetical protein
MSPLTHLCIQGRLAGSPPSLVLRPSYGTALPKGAGEPPTSRLVAEALGEKGEVLTSARLTVVGRCTGERTAERLAVRGWLPFPDVARRLRFRLDGLSVHEVEVSRSAPTLTLDFRPKKLVAGRTTVRFRAKHPEGKPVESFLRYSHDDGRSYARVGLRTTSDHAEVDFDALPGGPACRIAVVATDGARTTIATSVPFAVTVKPCRALLLSPEAGRSVAAGTSIELVGQGFYLEERAPELSALAWTSSRDGALGTGRRLRVTLSPGNHRLTLSAGVAPRVGTAEVDVVVGAGGSPMRAGGGG